jgi:hypothetical protein
MGEAKLKLKLTLKLKHKRKLQGEGACFQNFVWPKRTVPSSFDRADIKRTQGGVFLTTITDNFKCCHR